MNKDVQCNDSYVEKANLRAHFWVWDELGETQESVEKTDIRALIHQFHFVRE